jgi:hypothetical protein
VWRIPRIGTASDFQSARTMSASLSTVFQLRPVPMPSMRGVAFLKISDSPWPLGNQK